MSLASTIRRTLHLDEMSYHAPSFIKSRTKAAVEPFGFSHAKTTYLTAGGRAYGARHTFEHPDGRKIHAEMGKDWSDSGRSVIGSRWTVEAPKSKPLTFFHKQDLVDHLTDYRNFTSPRGIEPGGVEIMSKDFTPRLTNHAILTARGYVKSQNPSAFSDYTNLYTHPDKPGVKIFTSDLPFGDPTASLPPKRPMWPGHTLSRWTKNSKLDAFLDKL